MSTTTTKTCDNCGRTMNFYSGLSLITYKTTHHLLYREPGSGDNGPDFCQFKCLSEWVKKKENPQ